MTDVAKSLTECDIAAELVGRCAGGFPDVQSRHAGHRLNKYFDFPVQARFAARRVAGLGLLGVPRVRVLDLGTAFGYFPAACELAGHAAMGLDEDMPILHDVAPLVGFRYVPHLVVKYRPLPDLGKFDLVTAYGVNFGYHDPTYWGWDEYEFLADDLMARLNPGGRIVFRFNRGPNTDFLCDEKMWRQITGCECRLDDLKLEVRT